MLAISIVNLILSVFGIAVSSLFITFWCSRYFCARFFASRTRGFVFAAAAQGSRVVEHNPSGVSPLIIERFPLVAFRQDSFLSRQDAMCAVCLGEYKEDEILRFLPQCGHNFHKNCIDAWLRQHATCPVCRISLQGYFVGRLMSPLQLSPPPTHLVRVGSRTSSRHSGSGSLSSFPSGDPGLPAETQTCNQPTSRNTLAQNDNNEGHAERPDFQVVDVGVTQLVERG